MSDEHDAVSGGFICDDCDAERSTPLGIARHRERCRGGRDE
jgi:hypothetical protein